MLMDIQIAADTGLYLLSCAGIIGVADLSICDKDTSFGKVVPDYSGIVFIEYNDGTITVSWGDYKEINIYTSYEEEDYDEDEEESYENSEEEDW